MQDRQPRLLPLAAQSAVCHTLTYMVIGALAFHLLHYADAIAKPGSGMRPLTNLVVLGGPLLQPVRGVLFALVLYPLRQVLFGRRYGWLLMAWILIGVGILNTFGPAGGSIEGMIYTPAPPLQQMRGWLEIMPQATLFSALLCYWVNHPEKRWLTWLLSTVFVVLIVFFGLVLIAREMGVKGF